MKLTLQSLKKHFSVRELLHKEMCEWEKARPTTTLHASELMKEQEFCPREYALLDLSGAKRPDQFIGAAQKATFAHGRDLENHIRNEWLRDHVVGRWKCEVCSYLHDKFTKAPKIACPRCTYQRWRYEEIRFESPHSSISGGIDMILDVGDKKHRITEIKSIDKDKFKELQAPMAEHNFRTNLYLRVAEESLDKKAVNINTNSAHLVYVAKSFGVKDDTLKRNGGLFDQYTPFKEFVIKRDDSVTQTSVNKARALKVFRENQSNGIPCGVCVNGLTKRAQQCAAKKECWGGKFSATISWTEGGKIRHPGKKTFE